MGASLRDAEAAHVEAGDAAARLAKFMADAELVTRLQLVEFGLDTPEWREFAGMLVEYGHSVFTGWCMTGLLRQKAFDHGGEGVRGAGRIPEDLHMLRDEATEFAGDLMIYSIPRFRSKTLMNDDHDRRWSSQGGTSLTSFFVGRALMDTPDVWTKRKLDERRALGMIDERVWARARSQRPGRDDDDSPTGIFELLDNEREPDPARTVITQLELNEIFVEDALVRAMHELRQMRFSVAEIAELLTVAGHATTPAAVRTAMTRLNAKARKGRAS